MSSLFNKAKIGKDSELRIPKVKWVGLTSEELDTVIEITA